MSRVDPRKRKQELDAYKPFDERLAKDLDNWLRIEFSYTNSLIDGNKLTREEVAALIRGEEMRSQLDRAHAETINYAIAYDWMRGTAGNDDPITQYHLKEIHAIMMRDVNGEFARKYRTGPGRILGPTISFVNYLNANEMMLVIEDLLINKKKEKVVEFAIEMHFRLLMVQPFFDGNEKMARMLLNLILLKNDYPPAIFRSDDRKYYWECIEGAMSGRTKGSYYDLIHEAVDRGFDVYFESLEARKLSYSCALKYPKRYEYIWYTAKDEVTSNSEESSQFVSREMSPESNEDASSEDKSQLL